MTLSFSCSFGRRQDDLISSSVPSTTSTPTVTSAAGLQRSLLSSTSTTAKLPPGSSSAGTQSRWVPETFCVQVSCVLMYVHALLCRRMWALDFFIYLVKIILKQKLVPKQAIVHVWGKKKTKNKNLRSWIVLLKIKISFFDSSGWAFWLLIARSLILCF